MAAEPVTCVTTLANSVLGVTSVLRSMLSACPLFPQEAIATPRTAVRRGTVSHVVRMGWGHVITLDRRASVQARSRPTEVSRARGGARSFYRQPPPVMVVVQDHS
jgi:hypothetical protein